MAPLLLLLALVQGGPDPVQVRATLTDEEVRVGETTVLRIDVETDGPRAQIPRFHRLPAGLELQATRDYDQRQFSLPGGVRRFIAREFVLRGGRPGRYRVPSLDVVVDGRTYATRSVILTVTAAAGREGASAPTETGVALRGWLDADTVFVGQQVTLNVEALFSSDVRLRLRRAPEYEPPSPSGFWIHDIPDPPRPGSRRIGGEVYEVQAFRRAFFPLTPGDYTIPPAHLEYEMRRGLLYAPETRDVASEPLPLVVLPVPAADQPPAFTGAVGDYTIVGRLEPARVPAGEAAVLTLEVTGRGNVKALPPPALPELRGIEVFPPSEEAETEVQGADVRGTKRFSWVLIPRVAGEHTLPAIRYAFFNPDDGAYHTAVVPPLPLTVEPGAVAAPAPPAATLRYVKTAPAPGDPLGWVRSSWFAALQLLPLLLLLGALLVRRRHARAGVASPSALRRRRRAGLRELESRVEARDAALFTDADAWARAWLAERLGLPRPATSDPAALVACGVAPDTATAVRGLLDRFAAARYAPTPPGPEARRDMVRALRRVLERVDREAAPPRPAAAGRGAHALGVLLLFLLPALGATSAAAQAPEPDASDAFRHGVAAFDAGRYDEAAGAFDRYLQRRPDDAAGWYNLGTAYWRAGFSGYAVWAWLRALPLAPRDGDTRHNLRVAGVAPELVARVAPPLPLRADELLLLAAVAWLVAGAAGALWVLRRRTGPGVVAGVAVVAALALGATAWDSTRRGETLIVLDAAELRAGPTLRGEPVTALEPGDGLAPVQVQGDWVRVRTLGGEEGWIESRMTGTLGGG